MWKERVEGGLGELPKKGPDWSAAMGQWLSEIRMDGVEVTQPPGGRLIQHTVCTDLQLWSHRAGLCLFLAFPSSGYICT